MKRIKYFINDQEVSKETIDAWELKHLKTQYNFLKRKGYSLNEQLLQRQTLDQARQELGQLKAAHDPQIFRDLLHTKYTLGNWSSKIAAWLSGGRRKYSITEFVVSDCDLTPQEVIAEIENIMLENTKEHLYMNLATNPDHFVLISPAENIQEVVEVTGGSPLPTRFFAHYGDETGLTSVLTDGYKAQAAGAARLEDGMVIGGVRHQVKKEGTGFRFKALVEFPGILPNFMIRQHQYHLACEFRQWINYVINPSQTD